MDKILKLHLDDFIKTIKLQFPIINEEMDDRVMEEISLYVNNHKEIKDKEEAKEYLMVNIFQG